MKRSRERTIEKKTDDTSGKGKRLRKKERLSEKSGEPIIFDTMGNLFTFLPIEIIHIVLEYCDDKDLFRVFLAFSINRQLTQLNVFNRDHFFAKRLISYGVRDVEFFAPDLEVSARLYFRESIQLSSSINRLWVQMSNMYEEMHVFERAITPEQFLVGLQPDEQHFANNYYDVVSNLIAHNFYTTSEIKHFLFRHKDRFSGLLKHPGFLNAICYEGDLSFAKALVANAPNVVKRNLNMSALSLAVIRLKKIQESIIKSDDTEDKATYQGQRLIQIEMINWLITELNYTPLQFFSTGQNFIGAFDCLLNTIIDLFKRDYDKEKNGPVFETLSYTYLKLHASTNTYCVTEEEENLWYGLLFNAMRHVIFYSGKSIADIKSTYQGLFTQETMQYLDFFVDLMKPEQDQRVSLGSQEEKKEEEKEEWETYLSFQ